MECFGEPPSFRCASEFRKFTPIAGFRLAGTHRSQRAARPDSGEALKNFFCPFSLCDVSGDSCSQAGARHAANNLLDPLPIALSRQRLLAMKAGPESRLARCLDCCRVGHFRSSPALVRREHETCDCTENRFWRRLAWKLVRMVSHSAPRRVFTF